MNFPVQAIARVEAGSGGRGSRVLPSGTCLYPVLPSRRDSFPPIPGLTLQTPRRNFSFSLREKAGMRALAPRLAPRFMIPIPDQFLELPSTNIPVQAIARVEAGWRERESRPALRDPVQPSRLVPANTCLHPSKPAAPILLLPPGEGRDEGRSLHCLRLVDICSVSGKRFMNFPVQAIAIRADRVLPSATCLYPVLPSIAKS
jgi:hypothetical protein